MQTTVHVCTNNTIDNLLQIASSCQLRQSMSKIISVKDTNYVYY